MSSHPAAHWMAPSEAHVAEVRGLSTLLEASQALSGTLEVRSGLSQVLEILWRHLGAVRSEVELLDEQTREVGVVVTAGAPRPGSRARHRREEEGIAGQVMRHGKAVVVPRGGRGLEQEMTIVAAPIVLEGTTIGAVAVDLPYEADRDYHRLSAFVGVVGSLIAHAVRVQRVTAVAGQRLMDENTRLRLELKEHHDFSNLIGTSGPMRQVRAQVAQVAPVTTTVMLRGESGTGKELLAKAIHYNSPRARKPFVKVSCAALPHDLLESELFGCEQGAFTGAQGPRKGRFKLADGGSLFLDEIGELTPATQTKLLRVLQAREFERLGGTETIRVNIRLIVATNRDLEQAIAAGAFREDLYYRLNIFPIFVPPLRERKADVLLLCEYFLEQFTREHGKRITRISTPAIDMLMAYHWPGNVRELANVVERAVVVCDSSALHAHHLPPTLQTAEATGTQQTLSLKALLDAVEKDALQDALKSARGSRSRAARLLSTTERIFNYKVRKHRIDWRRFRG